MLTCYICGAGVDSNCQFADESTADLCERCEAAAAAATEGTPEFDFHANADTLITA